MKMNVTVSESLTMLQLGVVNGEIILETARCRDQRGHGASH